jgi:hypothetical protein
VCASLGVLIKERISRDLGVGRRVTLRRILKK